MSYWLGEIVDLAFDVEVDGVDTPPTAFQVTVTKPDGTTSTVSCTEDPAGHFAGQYQIDQAGHHTWTAISTGVVSVAAGSFDAFDPNPQVAPITGLAAPWTDAAALACRPEIVRYNDENTDSPIPPSVLTDACRFASEVLYALSGRQFSGLARTYCRPVGRPEGWDARSWGSSLIPSYWGAWGSSYATGYGAGNALLAGTRANRGYPAEIPLNFPVQRIEAVLIDGTSIPADEYRVDDFRLLVRTRPTADATPTVMSGWPLWQNLALPDTEVGTFCVDEETEILTADGWRTYRGIEVGDEVYVLDPHTLTAQFEPLLAVNVFPAAPRTIRRIETANFSSLTTVGHRWPVWQKRPRLKGGDRFEWRTSASLTQDSAIFRTVPCADLPQEPKWSDAFVEVVAWFWTEGCLTREKEGTKRGGRRIEIVQSETVYPQHVASIRRALNDAFPGLWREYKRAGGMVGFRSRVAATDALTAVTGAAKEPSGAFLRSLTLAQLHLLIDRCIDGDGTISKTGHRVWNQQDDRGLRAFEMACALAGIPTNTYRDKERLSSWGKPYRRGTVSLLKAGFAKPLDTVRVARYRLASLARRAIPVDSTETYNGLVWCPTTPSGTWLARRRGTVYFTGNSVTYRYGSQAPQSGIIAAQVFAAELALDMVGADNRLPARITEISRQGESVAVIDSLQSLQQGWTGIPVCDWFIYSVNQNKLQRRASVWTPDMGRVRTPTSGG